MGKHSAPKCAKKRPARVTETSDYVAMMLRIFKGYGDRVSADPVALVHLGELIAALANETNRGIYLANDGEHSYSQNDMARILGVSRQAVAKRIANGELVHAGRVDAGQKANAAGRATPLVRIADLRRRRAEGLRAVGLDDRTGSDREREAI